MRLLILLALIAPFSVSILEAGGASRLSAIEQRIARHVDEHNAAALALLERTVNINSGTMNLAGVQAVGAVFRAEFDDLGLETEWIDGAGFNRAGHLVARHRGDGLHLLLIGHLDTVFEADSVFQKYERLGGSRARGPGTTDMKGGNVILLQALRALDAVGALDALSVTVVLIGDEEKMGASVDLARAELIAAGKAADVALGFEDGDGDPRTAVISRRGGTGWRLEVEGRPSHSSQIFREDVGVGAIFEISRVLYEFHAQLSNVENLTFSPGVILGGTDVTYDPERNRGTVFGKGNVVARQATASGDLRAVSPEQLERAKRRMRAILAENLPHTSAAITFADRYPPMAPTRGNRELLDRYDRVSRDLGFGPVAAVDPRKAGAADIAFVAAHVEMALDGLGLMGTGGHTEKEIADLETLPMQTKRAAILMHRLGQEQPRRP